MKADIHPIYYPKAKVKCACGNVFTIGATKPEMAVEVCSNCHPFYTGQEKLLDVAGRVEKFRVRQEKAKLGETTAKLKKTSKSTAPKNKSFKSGRKLKSKK